MSSIAKKSFLIMATNVASALIGFIALASMTRFVGAEYGVMMWAMSFVATFNAISDLGFSSSHVKRVSEGQDLESCVSTFAFIKAGLGGLMALLTIGSILAYSLAMGRPIQGASLDVLLLFVLYWLLCDLSHIFAVTYSARMESSKAMMIHLVDPLVRSPMLVLLAVWRMGAAHLALAYVLGALAMLLVGIWLLRRDGVRIGRPVFVRSYLGFAKPLIAITFGAALLANLDKVLLGFFWDELQVAYYSSSYKLVELVITFGIAVNVLLFPTFSEWHSQGRREGIGPLSEEAQRLISMLGMPVTAFLAVFAYPLSGILFGHEFMDAGGPMRFLALALYVILVAGIMEQVLLAYNRPDLMARAFTARMAVNIVLLGALIPVSLLGLPLAGMGASGGALAFLCGWLVYAAILSVLVNRTAGCWPYRRLWLHLLAGGATAIGLLLVSAAHPMAGVLDLLALAALSVLLFLGILTLAGEFRRQDLDLLLSVLDPRSMLRYIRDEVSRR